MFLLFHDFLHLDPLELNLVLALHLTLDIGIELLEDPVLFVAQETEVLVQTEIVQDQTLRLQPRQVQTLFQQQVYCPQTLHVVKLCLPLSLTDDMLLPDLFTLEFREEVLVALGSEVLAVDCNARVTVAVVEVAETAADYSEVSLGHALLEGRQVVQLSLLPPHDQQHFGMRLCQRDFAVRLLPVQEPLSLLVLDQELTLLYLVGGERGMQHLPDGLHLGKQGF